MKRRSPSAAAVPPTISAPYDRFREGIRQSLGYDLQEEGDRLVLCFSPWFTETTHPHREPCLWLHFRKEGDRVVLEEFLVEEEEGVRPMDIEAGRDALQAWMECVCG